MISPVEFLLLALAWLLVVFWLIYRQVQRINREADEDQRLHEEMEERLKRTV